MQTISLIKNTNTIQDDKISLLETKTARPGSGTGGYLLVQSTKYPRKEAYRKGKDQTRAVPDR